MASRTTPSAQISRSEPAADVRMAGALVDGKLSTDVSLLIDSLKKQFSADRCVQIKKKIEENKQQLNGITSHVYNLSKMRKCPAGGDNNMIDLLTRRQEDALNMLNGLELNNGDRDNSSSQEDNLQSSTTVLLGSNFGGKNVVRPIKMSEVQKLPPYTTWIFLDRNQRMTEDQSVVGRRRIYYDPTGGEALICSDSEEEIIEEEEDKKEFVDCEDYILRLTIEEIGSSDAVHDALGDYFGRKPCEIKRYETPSNILYRQDMNFFQGRELSNPLRRGILKPMCKLEMLLSIKIWMQLWILLIIFSVVDVLYLIVDCMDALKILFSQQRNNSTGAIQMRKRVYHVATIAIVWL